MAADVYFESVCTTVATMNKSEVKRRLLHFEGPLRLDFTEEYLDRLDLDRLRHILLAALMAAHRKHAC